MSIVNVTNVAVLDNPTAFTNPFQLEIQFECLQQLEEDLEWKLLYVGSAEDSAYDQVLEEVMVGPVVPGVHKFVLQAPAPNHLSIQNQDLIGVTVVLLTCSYMEQEFIRIGYYVNNEYSEPYDPETPPNPVDIKLLFRNILADQPRVTRFAINWSGAPMTEAEGVSAEGLPAVSSGDNGEDVLLDVENDQSEEDEEEEDEEDEDDEGDVEIDIENEEDEDEDDGDDDGEEDDEEGVQVMHYEDSMDVQQMQVFEGSAMSNSGFA